MSAARGGKSNKQKRNVSPPPLKIIYAYLNNFIIIDYRKPDFEFFFFIISCIMSTYKLSKLSQIPIDLNIKIRVEKN